MGKILDVESERLNAARFDLGDCGVRLGIQVADSDCEFRFGLQIQIAELDCRFGLRIEIAD